MISLSVVFISYLIIAIRWRHGINIWESLYSLPAGLGHGALLSAQFVGLVASADIADTTTAVSVYYLSQQVGSIIAVAISSAFLRHYFHATLLQGLNFSDDRDAVSNNSSHSVFCWVLSWPSP